MMDITKTKQEEIREYFAGEYCSFMSQEFCSDCKYLLDKVADYTFLKKGRTHNGYCPDAFSYADVHLFYLDSKGVVLKVNGELPKVSDEHSYFELCAQANMLEAGFTAVEPLIEEKVNAK